MSDWDTYMNAIEAKYAERNNKIKDDFMDGFTMDDIGERHGISRERVRTILRKFGLTGKKRDSIYRKRVLYFHDKKQMTPDEIMQETGFNESQIRRYLKETSRRPHRRTDRLKANVVALYENGYKQRDIAEQLSIAQSYVSNILISEGANKPKVDEHSVLDMYDRDEYRTLKDIGNAHDTSIHNVRRILRKRNRI